MASFSNNLFNLLEEDVQEPETIIKPKKKTIKKQEEPKQRGPIVFPGDLSSQKKKKKQKKKNQTPAPQLPPPPSNGTQKSSAAKSSSPIEPARDKEAKKEQNRQLTFSYGRTFRPSVQKLVDALDERLQSKSAFFGVSLSTDPQDDLRKLLRETPYRAIDNIIRDDRFLEALLGDLRIKWADYGDGVELRAKPMRVQVEKMRKDQFVSSLAGLLTDSTLCKNPMKEPAACELLFGLLEPIFGVAKEENRYLSRLEENIETDIGSMGTTKSSGYTLLDFIQEPAKKGKKKGQRQTQEDKNKRIALPNPPAPVQEVGEEEEEPDKDIIYNPEAISKMIPFGWYYAKIQPTFLRVNGEGKEAQESKDWYFEAQNKDNAFVFWDSSHAFFILTNGKN